MRKSLFWKHRARGHEMKWSLFFVATAHQNFSLNRCRKFPHHKTFRRALKNSFYFTPQHAKKGQNQNQFSRSRKSAGTPHKNSSFPFNSRLNRCFSVWINMFRRFDSRQRMCQREAGPQTWQHKLYESTNFDVFWKIFLADEWDGGVD